MTKRRDDIRLIQGGAEEVLPDPVDPPAPETDDTGPVEAPDEPLYAGCPVTALGVSGLTRYFLDERCQLIALTAKDLSRLNILSMWGESFRQLYDRYPRVSREGSTSVTVGWRPEIVAELLIEAANRRGVWNATERERGAGAWRGDDGELVLHCGQTVMVFAPEGEAYRKRREVNPGLVGRYVYPAREALPMPAPERAVAAPEGPGARTLALLESWRWRRAVDPVLLLGWIGAAMIGGALKWRPLVWTTGGKGTGKSTLHDLIRYIFGDALVPVSDSSAAGIWQKIGRASLPVTFDELEAEEDNRKQQAIIKLARMAASGGLILRGGADHNSTEFVARSCFFFSSILIPPLLGQDRSRLAILELLELAADAKPPDLEIKAWRAVGAGLLRRLVDGWPRFGRALEFYRASLASRGHSARGADQFGTLLACADLLLFDGEPDSDIAEKWLRHLEAATLTETEDDGKDEERCLEHLMTTPVDAFRSGLRYSFAGWVKNAASDALEDAPGEANKVLGTYGLKVMARAGPDGKSRKWLAIANYNQGLAAVFEGTHWAGRSGSMGVWVQAFRRLPGAERSGSAVYFAGAIGKATLVPIELVVQRDPDRGPATLGGPL